jgi:hypothetical protein
MLGNREQWLEMSEKVKGLITYPDNADSRIQSVIESYGREVEIQKLESFIVGHKLDKEIRAQIEENVHETVETAIDNILMEGSPEGLKRLHHLLKDVSEFEFSGQRILSLATPLSEMLGDVETVNDVIKIAKDEILWIFYAVYVAATYIVPAFEEV